MSQYRYVAKDVADADWDSDIATDDVAGGEVTPMWTIGQSLNVGPTRKRSQSENDTCQARSKQV